MPPPISHTGPLRCYALLNPRSTLYVKEDAVLRYATAAILLLALFFPHVVGGQAIAPTQADLVARHQAVLQAPFLSANPWLTDFSAAKAAAAAQGKPILAYFTRSYRRCGPCRKVEQGALSSPEFAALQQNYVLFCHVTSRVNGQANPKLHRNKGGRIFPYFAALDAGGKVLARRQAFVHDAGALGQMMSEATATATELAQETASANAGDDGGKVRRFLLRERLGHLDQAAAKERVDQLLAQVPTHRTALRKKLTRVRANIIVRELLPLETAGEVASAGATFATMFGAQEIPSDPQCRHYFFTYLISHARSTSNRQLMQSAIERYKTWLQLVAPDDQGLQRYIASQERVLALAQLQPSAAPATAASD